MRVKVSDHVFLPKIIQLESALTPSVNTCGESIGVVEDAAALAELNALAIGRLLAWFVESNHMSIETAKFIASVIDDIEPYVEPPAESVFGKPKPAYDPKWSRKAPEGD